MTTLATHLLDTTITQPIRILSSKVIVGIRINLMKVGVLTNGQLTLNVKYLGNIIKTVAIDYTDLNLLGNYWHGMKAFEFDAPLSIKKLSTSSELVLNLEFSTTCTQTNDIYLGLIHEPHPNNVHHLTGEPYYPTYGNDSSRDVWNNPYSVDVVILK